MEVWFDQSELRGGDQWDAKIRTQIKACALFLPVISATTQARDEAYFRLEWKLADDRSHLMAPGKTFIVPVVIDETPDAGAAVPDSFNRAQWTRLAGGVPSTGFIEQVKRLLDAPRKPALKPDHPRPPTLPPYLKQAGQKTGDRGQKTEDSRVESKPAVPGWMWAVLGVVLIGVAVGVVLLRQPAPGTASASEPKSASAVPSPSSLLPVPSNPPKADSKSIAVLPFANMSADKENDFLADGIHEDVLTSLAKIRDLKVISRTSVLAYRDTGSRNLKKIAADLGVAVVLEGSVRRSGNRVRVTAQLIDARTDEHLWAENYDGDTSDVFALQAKLAQQIAAALKATLTPGERSLIERRPTQDQQAYEFYQRALALELELDAYSTREKYEAIVNLHEQAIARDPAFALAHGALAGIQGLMYWFGAIDPSAERRARAEAELALMERLAPDAPETRKARGLIAYFCANDWNKALVELTAAEASLPNDAVLQNRMATTHRRLGQWTEALRHFERSASLNPYDQNAITGLVETNSVLRRHPVVIELTKHYLALFPDSTWMREFQVKSQYALDQDRAAWLRARAALPVFHNDKLGLREVYLRALREGDLAAADRALADPRMVTIRSEGGALEEPVALHRAELALLRGEAVAAKQYAAEATAALQAGRWSPRQEPLVKICAARAQICAGQVDAGASVMRATLEQLVQQDKFIVAATWLEAARTLAAAGRTEEALYDLRRLFSGPAYASAPEVRDDPFFAKLKSDPRFEEILRNAKQL